MTLQDVDLVVRELGTGYGSPSAMEFLRNGQLRKRTVMLRIILDEATKGAQQDAAISNLSGAYEYLAAAQQRDGDYISALLLYPNLGIWLSHCVRRLRSKGQQNAPLWPDLAYLGWAAATAMIEVGSPGTMSVVVRHGTVMLPGLGLARVGDDDECGVGELSWDGHGRLGLTYGKADTVIDDLSSSADPHWIPLKRLSSGQDVTFNVTLDDLDPFREPRTISAKYSASAVVDQQVAVWQRNFAAAWQLLDEEFRAYAGPMQAGLRSIVPMVADPRMSGTSNTWLDAFGNVGTSAPRGPQQLALTLIHEFQHGKLGALTDVVKLHDRDLTEQNYAPWRDDPRPLGALLQGLYAHVGVTDFWRIHRRTSEDLLADIEFVRWRTQVERATAEVAASGLLNRHGQIFLEAIAATVSEWRDEAIPKKARQIADDAAMSHRVSWCVRNLVPRSEELSGIKSRWLSGQTSGVVSSSLHRDKRDVPAHHRSRLPASYLEVLNSARQSPDAGTQIDVPPGDMSYARGDFDQALAEYLHELEADPLHPQPWAGIALTVQHLVDGEHKSCLVHRADLVAHLFALLRSEDPNIDIVKLIAWLSDSTDGE